MGVCPGVQARMVVGWLRVEAGGGRRGWDLENS